MIRSQPYRFEGLGGVVQWHDAVGSTNDVAKAMAEAGADEGAAVIADFQTAGRGRQGRPWISERGTGLYFSIILRPRIPLDMLGHLTLLSAIAVSETASRFLDESGSRAQADIKWPNDVLLDGKKLAGILVETALIGGQVKWAVVGVGVNLLAPSASAELRANIAALAESRPPVERDAFAWELLRRLGEWYGAACGGQFDRIRQRWRQLSSFASNRAVEIETGEGTVRGVTRGLNHEGALLLRLESGEERAVFVGEVLRVITSRGDAE